MRRTSVEMMSSARPRGEVVQRLSVEAEPTAFSVQQQSLAVEVLQPLGFEFGMVK